MDANWQRKEKGFQGINKELLQYRTIKLDAFIPICTQETRGPAVFLRKCSSKGRSLIGADLEQTRAFTHNGKYLVSTFSQVPELFAACFPLLVSEMSFALVSPGAWDLLLTDFPAFKYILEALIFQRGSHIRFCSALPLMRPLLGHFGTGTEMANRTVERFLSKRWVGFFFRSGPESSTHHTYKVLKVGHTLIL